jgi:phytoene desaturase
VGDSAAEIERLCGAAEAEGFRRFVSWVSELYRVERRDFIERNIDSPLDLLTPNLARLAALGGFRRLAPMVGRHLKDERTRRLLSFQSMYAGLAPHDALALYAVIAYMDSVAGVFFPRGGMHAGRASSVITDDGERIPCDAVVLTPDLPVAYRELLPAALTPQRVKRLRYSPSCFLMLAGSSASYSHTAHHSIHFGRSWKGTFDELIQRRELMSDPSFLVSNPTRTDPSLAPAGRQSYYVLFPTPHLDARVDWSVVGPRYRDECVARLEAAGYVGFGDAIEVEQVTTPADWAARGMERGSPFAAAHTFFQTGPFRPSNLAPGVEGVVFAGSGTRPGVGVPMVLISGRLAAERITGPVR